MAYQFQTIRVEFLDEAKYEALSKNSRSLNNKYGDLCDQFKQQFQAMSEVKKQFMLRMSPERAIQSDKKVMKFKFIEQLKCFIKDFMGISKDMADYQIGCLQSLKESNHPELEIIRQVVQKVKQNKSLCEQIQRKSKVLVQTYAAIKKSYSQFEKSLKNPILYYQPEALSYSQKQLKQKIAKDWSVTNQILAHGEQCQGRIQQFQPCLSTFRKRLIKNKYSVLKKLVYLISNTKTATVELFDALRNCAINKRKDYLYIIDIKDDDIQYLKDYLKHVNESDQIEHYTEENKKWKKYTSKSINQFEEAFEEIQFMVAQLIDYFRHFCDKCNQMHEAFHFLTNQINDYFEEEQTPYNLMKQLLDIQTHFNKKISNIVLQFLQVQSKLKNQKNGCKKQAQILLTIIKVNRNNHKSLMEDFNKNNQLLNLINKISFDSTKRALLVLYDSFIDLYNELLNKLQYSRARKKHLDSMQISHSIVELLKINKKIPLKQEYWLWREWKSQIEINFEYVHQYFKDVEKKMEIISSATTVKDSTIMQQYEATLVQRRNQTSGHIEIKVNSFQFTSLTINLCIPWKEIAGVEIKSKVWKDVLIIQTTKGPIKFFKIEDIEDAVKAIKEIQEKGGSIGVKKEIEKKAEVQLSEGELATITERKLRIQSQIPDLKDYRLMVQQTFNNYRIDQIYQLFYSDKQFNFYGKEEPCFISYNTKKAGNNNLAADKFDKPGPEYYSGDAQVSFQNCPVFSSRKQHFKHPMKPSSIPFMPKQSTNVDSLKMYWISHEELILVTQSKTSGVPYGDNFVILIAHKITKVENGVKIQILLFVKWLIDTMMKNTIMDNINPEVDKGMESFIAEMKKLIKLMASIQKGQKVDIPKDQSPVENDDTNKSPDELSKVKLHNKALVIAFVLVVLFNLINMIFF